MDAVQEASEADRAALFARAERGFEMQLLETSSGGLAAVVVDTAGVAASEKKIYVEIAKW